MNRREFLKQGVNTALILGVVPSLIFKCQGSFAITSMDVEGLSISPGGEQSWRVSSQLNDNDLERYMMDLTPWDKTPRNEKYPYVAAKLDPPYTATEVIYMLTVGQYFAWWSHESPLGGMQISNRGGINSMIGQREVWSALTPDTLRDYLYKWPEDYVYLWVLERYYTPKRSRFSKVLQNAYRTGKNYPQYSDKWSYACNSQKTAPMGNCSYSDQYYLYKDYNYGDTLMIPWYYTWRFLGTDILYEGDIVRFPKTRKEIEIRGWDGKSEKRDVRDITIMGHDYPAYTKDGGVPCYVVEGTANNEFFKPQHKKIILWVDMYACRELRRERYDLDNNLEAIMEARNRLELKDKDRWGYSILIYLAWDLRIDHMSVNHYDFHRPPKSFNGGTEDPEEYFRPNPVFMCSEMFPVPFSTMIFTDPEQFYLRPKLMTDKFPQDRNIQVPENTLKLIDAQNKAEQLVFL